MDIKSPQVLIVEDDLFLSGIYRKKFELEKFRITTINNGAAAINEVRRKRPDIILLDILVPQLDGFSILATLKKDPELCGIPVILITNLGQSDDVKKGLSLGAADYLIKAHFKPSEVVQKVRQVLAFQPS